MKQIPLCLVTTSIIIGGISLVFYTYNTVIPVLTPEQIESKNQLEKDRSERKLLEDESMRKTMLLREEIEKQCRSISQSDLDANTMSVGEYVGLKLRGF